MADGRACKLDNESLRAMDAPSAAVEDAIEFGRLLAKESTVVSFEADCVAYPPDGVKVTLKHGDRRLTMFFFGDRRFIYGKRCLATGDHAEGELSLSDASGTERTDLLKWLEGVSPP